MYDEPQHEPSLADEILNNATALLIAAIKDEAAQHFKKLKADNRRLKRQNTVLRKAEARVCERESAVMLKQKELERKAKYMTVKEFFGQRAVIMYKAGKVRRQQPKCDECDEKRHRYYKTPLGKKAYEGCTCASFSYTFEPEAIVLYELRKHRGKLLMWFNPYKNGDDEGYGNGCIVKNEHVYTPGATLNDLNEYDVRFSVEADCQTYCDWLNERDKSA